MLRRALLVFGALELAVGLTIACSSFSADQAPATPADATDEDAGLALDAPSPDGQVPDAATPACSAFDAAGAQPPSGDLTAFVCGSATKNLLGDPQNCGWCGHACLDALTCTKGVCEPFVVVTGPANTSLELDRVDDTNVYWVDQGRVPAALFRASKVVPSDQSAAAKLAEVDASEPVSTQVFGLTVDRRIYLHTYSQLFVAPFAGGPLAAFSATTMGSEITPLATSGDHLFQTSHAGTGTFVDFFEADGAVLSTQTGIGFAYDLTATPDGRFAFFVGRTAADAGIVDGSFATHAALYRYTIATKDLTRVAVFDAMDAPGSVLVADDDFVYFPESSAGSILKVAVEAPSGTQPAVLSKGDGRKVRYIALDDRRVYWFSSTLAPDYAVDDLLSVDKCGGGDFKHVAKEAGQSVYPRGLVVQGSHIYWTSSRTVLRVAK